MCEEITRLYVRKGFEAYLVCYEDYCEDGWYRSFQKDTRGEIAWWPLQENYTHIPNVAVSQYSDYILPVSKKLLRMEDNLQVGVCAADEPHLLPRQGESAFLGRGRHLLPGG